MGGVVGLPEGISQRAVAENNPQDNQVIVREAAAGELKEKHLRHQREVNKSQSNDRPKIGDRHGGQPNRRKQSPESSGKGAASAPEHQESQDHILDIIV